MAARWLHYYGFDGCHALAEWLENMHDSALCPLRAGARASDGFLGDVELQLASALLAVPGMAAHGPVVITSSTGQMQASPDGVQGAAPTNDAQLISLRSTGEIRFDRPQRLFPDPAVWARLNRFASKTYAPATEASRAAGAGAGLTDND